MYFLVYLLFDYKNAIIVGNGTELIKLKDKVKKEKEFKLWGEEKNILINFFIIDIYLYYLLIIIFLITVEQSYINNSNK